MANYSMQYTFGVSADTKNAQSALNALSKSLRELQTKQINFSVNDDRINKAAKAAQLLQHELKNAMNVNTGNLDLTKLNQGLQAAGTNVSQLGRELLNAGASGQKAFSNLVQTISTAQAPVKQLSHTLSSMGTVLMNTIKWQASSSLIHGLMSTVSGAISYAKNLNSTLTDIRVVTGQTAEDMTRFAKTANQMAKELSTSTNEFAKASLIYYQQGDNAELAAKKAAITTKAANVAFTASAQEMSEMLTAVWNSYQAGEDQLEHMVDVLAKLGATTASSMEEMATGMQKVAATANTVGVSMEQMSAMIATSASVTRQAPESIGTAWNTILSRIGGLKLGETLEDGVDLNKYSQALSAIGVNILDANGELRNMGTVIDEIGGKWDSFSQTTKSALAQTIGGARQYTQILAFFENFDKYQANINTAKNADGALQEQQEIYAESWEAASKRAQAAFETLYNQLIDDKAITQLTNFFTNLLNLTTKLTSAFGGAGNVIGLLVSTIAASNVDVIATKLGESMNNIKQLFTGQQEVNEYAQRLQEMKNTMTELSAEAGLTASSRIELEYDTQILSIKQQIAEQQGKLTKAQQETAQKTLENLEADKQYYMQIADLQEKATAMKNDQYISGVADNILWNRAVALQQKEQNRTKNNKRKKEPKWNTLGHAAQLGWKEAANEVSFNKNNKDKQESAERLIKTYGREEDQSGPITIKGLLHSVQKIKTDLANAQQIQRDMNQTFAADDWIVRMAQGEIQAKDTYNLVKQQIQNMSQSSLFDSSKIDSFQSQLDAIDYSKLISNTEEANEEIDKLDKILKSIKESLGSAEAAGNIDLTKIKEVLTSIDGIDKNKMEEIIDGIKAIPLASNDAEHEASENIKALSQKWNSSLNIANKATQKFITGVTTILQAVAVFNTIKNSFDTLSDPNIDWIEKVTTGLGALVTIAGITHHGLVLLQKHLVSTGVAAAATAGSVGILNKALIFLSSHAVLFTVLAVITALVAGFVALKIAADKEWEQNMAKRQEKLQESMNKTSESTKNLQTDLQNLQAIVSDTSLTYDEQLTKINEICSAYGVQATMLDVLSGNYSNLISSMEKAAKIQIDTDYYNAANNVDEADDIVLERTKKYGSAIDKTNNSVVGRNWWTGNINDKNELEALLKRQKEIESYGFAVSQRGITSTSKSDYNKLYSLLSSDDILNQFVTKKGSYLNELNSNLVKYGYNDILEAEKELHKVSLQRDLITSDNFDMFNMRQQKVEINELKQLIEEIDDIKTFNDRSFIADYLSGFDNYKEASDQYSALNILANQRAKIEIEVESSTNKEELQEKILNDLLENNTISVEALLKIKPTDIILDEDKKIYTITDEAKKIAENQVQIEQFKTRQTLLNENKDLMTQESFTQEDYDTLQKTHLFESSAELENFLHQSQATREQMWNNFYSSAVDAEAKGLEQAIANSKEHLPNLIEQLMEYYNELSAQSLLDAGFVSEDQIEGLSGENLYKKLDSLRTDQYRSIETNQEIIDKYNQLKTSDDQDAKNAFAKTLDLSNWDDTEIESKIIDIQNEITNSEKVIGAFDNVLNKGDNFIAAISDTRTSIKQNEDNLNAVNFYIKWTKEVDQATKAANNFSSALGQQGQLTAEVLAQLASVDSEIYQKYTSMTAENWNEHVYTQAVEYYDKLAILYKDDAAKLLEIQQQKEDVIKNYYTQLEELSKQSAEAELNTLDEQLDKIKTAYDTLNNMDVSNFTGIYKLKQALIDVGYKAEQADELIKNIGKNDENATTDELWAKANAEIALLLQQQEIQDQKSNAAKYIIAEEHNGFIYLNNDAAELTEIADEEAKYEIFTDASGAYLIEPNGNKLISLDPPKELAGYEIYFRKDGLGAYYVQGSQLIALKQGSHPYGIYTIYANPDEDSNGFIYLNEKGELKSLENKDAKYKIYAEKNNENSDWVYITDDGNIIQLKQVKDGSATYQIGVEPEKNTAWVFKKTDNGYELINHDSEDTGAKINMYLDAQGMNGKVSFDAATGTWKVNIDTEPVTKMINVVTTYDDIKEKILEHNKQWTSAEDTKHTYLEGTGFKPLDGEGPGSMNAIGDYYGYEGNGSTSDTGWLEEVQEYHGGDIAEWLEANDVVTNTGLLAKKVFKNAFADLSQEVSAVYDVIDANPKWKQTTADLTNAPHLPKTFYALDRYNTDYSTDTLLNLFKTKILNDQNASNIEVITDDGTSISFEDYIDKELDEYGDATKISIPTKVRYIANTPEGHEGQQPMTKEEFFKTPAITSLLGMIASWRASGSTLTSLFKNPDQRINVMTLLANMFEFNKETGELEKDYNEIAYYCMQGFIKGLKDGTPEANAVLEAFGANSLTQLRHAFGVASPSKYTRQIGLYLVEGLQEGIDSKEIQTDEFAKKVLDQIRKKLLNGTEEISKENFWNQLIPDSSESISKETKTDYLQTRGVKIERIADNDTMKYQIWDANTDNALLDTLFESEEAALDAAGEALLAEDALKEYYSGGFWEEKGVSSLSKVILSDLITKTLKELGKGDTIEDFLNNGGTFDDFISKLAVNYNEYLGDFETEAEATWYSILDIIEGTLNAIDDKDEKKAQVMLTRWKNIYEGIAAAREAAFKDEKATYGKSMSEEQRDALLTEKFLNGNFTFEDALNWLGSKVDISSQEMQYRTYKTRNLKSLGNAYIGFDHDDATGVPIIEDVVTYYNKLKENNIQKNVNLLMEEGLNGLSQAGAVAKGLDWLNEQQDETLITEENLMSYFADQYDVGSTTAKSYAMQTFAFKDAMDKDTSLNTKFDNADDKKSFIAEYLAEKIANKNNIWDPKIAEELRKFIEDPTITLSEKAQNILEQYAQDAVKALEDYYTYLENLATNLTNEYNNRTEKRNNDKNVAEKVGNGSDLTAKERAEWLKAQEHYGGAGGTAAGTITNIALAQSKDDWRHSIEQQLITQKGVDLAAYENMSVEDRDAQLQALAKQYEITAEASYALGEAEDLLASMTGYTNEEFRELETTLNKTANIDINTDQGKAELAELAYMVARTKQGYEDLSKVSKDSWKTLTKASKKGTSDYRKELANMRQIMSKMFNTDMINISSQFVEDHLDEMQKMAEGTEQEALKARDTIEDDLVAEVLKAQGKSNIEIQINAETDSAQNAIEYFQTALDQWDNKEYGFTLTADTSAASAQVIDALNSMLSAGTMTADEIEAALNAIGWEPEIEWASLPAEEEERQNIQGYIETLDGMKPVSQDIITTSQLVAKFPKIKSLSKGSPSSAKPPKSSGGGGGGGAKKKNYEKMKPVGEDRYHEVTSELEHMGNRLDKIDKLKARTWGRDHLKAINDEIAALKDENMLQKEYYEEAQTYYSIHKNMLQSIGAQIGENGVITNYEELMAQWTAEYNAAVAAYNALSPEQQEKESSKAGINEAEQIFEERTKLLEEFEEDANLVETIQNDILENQNKISAAIADGITYKIEFQFDYDERELSALDAWIERFEKRLAHQDDSWEKLRQKQDIYFTMDAKGRLNGGELYYLQQEYAELQRAYNNGNGDLNAADYSELLKDLEERIRDTVSNVEELRTQMSELYGNTLDLAKEELGRFTDQIDQMVSSVESLIELQGLTGNGDRASAVLGLYEAQYKASEANLKQSRIWLDTVQQQRDQILQGYNDQIASLGAYATAEQIEEVNQLYKPMLDKANEELIEAENNFYEGWKQTSEKVQALFEKQVDAAIEKFDEELSALTGTDFEFDQLESDYEYYTEKQERYLSTSKELYEVSKLNRQINQSIADSTTKQSKERLKLLQQEINKMSDKNRLTEYDVEMLQLQYKHALALQELEDKQNAKSVVRLTRDENGNYGYQYTADDKDIEDARQKVEDALQEINELSANRVSELEQQWISSEREYRDKIKEISADTSMTIQERQEKIAELTQQHQERMIFLQEQYSNASTALLTNQQYVQERYKQTILENTGELQDQMNKMAGLALLSGGDYGAYLQEQLKEGGFIWKAIQDMQENTESVSNTANSTWDQASTKASDYTVALSALQTELEKTNKTMQVTTQNILDYVAAWSQSEQVMNKLLSDSESLSASMRGQIGYQNAQAQLERIGANGQKINTDHYMFAWAYDKWRDDQAGYDSYETAMAAAKASITSIFNNLKQQEGDDANSKTINAEYDQQMQQALQAISIFKYSTGGLIDYTGPAWVDGTSEKPELMLNASDTSKLLQAVDFVRMLDDGTLANIQAAITQSTLGMLYSLSTINAPRANYHPEELQQNVQISAEFPNATDHNEIEQAFDDLINLATQYAYRK